MRDRRNVHGIALREFVDLPDGSDQLRRRLRVASGRSDPLRHVHHELPDRPDVRCGDVSRGDDLSYGSDGLRQRLRRHVDQHVQLRHVRPRVRGRRIVHGGNVRSCNVPGRADALRHRVCRHQQRSRELRRVRNGVHGFTRLRRFALSGELRGTADDVHRRHDDDVHGHRDRCEQLRFVRQRVYGRTRLHGGHVQLRHGIERLRRPLCEYHYGRRELRDVRARVCKRSHVHRRQLSVQRAADGLRRNVHAHGGRCDELRHVRECMRRGAYVFRRHVRDVAVPIGTAQLWRDLSRPDQQRFELRRVRHSVRRGHALRLERLSPRQ